MALGELLGEEEVNSVGEPLSSMALGELLGEEEGSVLCKSL